MVAAEIQSIVLNWTFPKLKWDAGYIFGESYFADNIRSKKILGDNLVQTLHFKAQKTDVQKGEATCSWLYNKTIDITNRISNTLLSIDIIFDIILFHTEAHHFYCVECVCEHVCGGFHFLRVFIPSLNLQLYFSHWFLLCPMLSFHLLLCSLSFHLLRKTSIIFHCSISLRYNTSVLLILPTQAFGSSQSSDLWLTSFPLSVRIIQSSIPTSYLPQLVQPSGFLISTAHLDRPFPQLLNLKTISIIHLALHFSLNSD